MADKKTMAIVGLILNIIILPGLGTIIGAIENKPYMNQGIIQLVLFLVGIRLAILLIGIPLMIAMWIWALVSGIKMVKEA